MRGLESNRIERGGAWTGDRYKVFVVSNVRLNRDALVDCLAQSPDLDVIGSAAERAARGQIGDLSADVAVIDTSNVIDSSLGRDLLEASPRTKILAFALSSDDTGRGWTEAGISACVPPEASGEDLAQATRQVAQGAFSCPPDMTALIFMRLARFLNHGRSGDYANTLTRRELDVLSLLEEGLCNKEIARKLSIRTATVKNHVHNILGKLQLRRRSEVPSRMTALREARFTRSRS